MNKTSSWLFLSVTVFCLLPTATKSHAASDTVTDLGTLGTPDTSSAGLTCPRVWNQSLN